MRETRFSAMAILAELKVSISTELEVPIFKNQKSGVAAGSAEILPRLSSSAVPADGQREDALCPASWISELVPAPAGWKLGFI